MRIRILIGILLTFGVVRECFYGLLETWMGALALAIVLVYDLLTFKQWVERK